MKQADKERFLEEIEQALFRFNRLLIDLKPEKHQQEVAEMLEAGTPLSTLEAKEFIKDVNNIWNEFYPS